MEYFILLETFVLSVLFEKDEYNFKNKTFKPMKVLVVFLLLVNIWFTFFLLASIHRIQQRVEQTCPQVFEVLPSAEKD